MNEIRRFTVRNDVEIVTDDEGFLVYHHEHADIVASLIESLSSEKARADAAEERARVAETWIAGLPTIPDHMELRELEAWIVRYDEYVSCRARKKKVPVVWCDYCDGCGWVEGGGTLKTKCIKCGGTGHTSRRSHEGKNTTDGGGR